MTRTFCSGAVGALAALIIPLGACSGIAAAQTVSAAYPKKLAVGAIVHGSDGVAIGTIAASDVSWVTVLLGSGKQIKVGRISFSTGPKGIVMDMTSGQVDVMAGGTRSN